MTLLIPQEPEPSGPVDEEDIDENDIVPLSKLHQLRQSSEVLACLSNRHLRELLEQIDKARDPVAALKDAMQIPIFIEFADACLASCGVDILDKKPQGIYLLHYDLCSI